MKPELTKIFEILQDWFFVLFYSIIGISAKIAHMSSKGKMTKKQAHNLMYFLWHQGYLKNNVTEDHDDYEYIIDLIIKNKINDEFIKDMFYF